MEETKFWNWMVKYLPIIGGVAAIVAPTTVCGAIFISVLSLNNAVRTELAAHGAAIAGLRAEVAGLRENIAEQRTETRSEIQALRTEMRSEIQALRAVMRSEIQELRTEIAGQSAETSSEIQALRSENREDIQALRAVIDEVKLDVVQIKARVENIERRLLDIELVDFRIDNRQ